MDSGTVEWWRRHGWTIALLLVAFTFAISVRTIWTYPIVSKWGALYVYAGGSDSYYHSRVMTYIIQTHHNLVHDPMLRFPVGSPNPREPLFDWMNALLGIVFAPFFGGNAVNAGAWFLDLQAPLWAALSVFPVYLIGREASGRRTGLMAALIFPFLSASINTSTFGYANYLSFYTFMLLVVVYSWIRTVKAVGHRRWIESYRQPSQYLPALRGMWYSERTAIKWAVFTGVAMGAFALSWQGYTYAIVVLVFTVIVAMVIERVRKVDSFGLYVVTWIIALIGLGMCAPYYVAQHQIKAFLELPALLLFGSLALLLPFLMLRDVPWVFSIPALVAVVGAGVLGLRFAFPSYYSAAVTGNGYFVKTLIYSTVAEAQAPSFDALIIGYGVLTFFLAFVGLALVGYLLVHHRFKRYHIAFLVFAVVSVYLPVSATKFFLVGTPAYALLSAEAIHRLIDVGGYPALRRSVASLTDRAGSFSAFRKSFKARHVLVLALVVGIVLPNVWIAIDAGIPSNSKSQLAQQINHTIPSWLKLNSSTPASNYLGAAGSGLDTPDQYDSAAYNWLARQDTGSPPQKRPAFVSWWDYGFQAIAQGQHPSVADNFQNGIDPAGQFLLSQNESLAIAILATTLLQGEIQLTHQPTLPTALNKVLANDGVNLTALHHALDDEPADYQAVIHHPRTYLPVNPSTLTLDNAMYLVTSYYLAGHLSTNAVARVYDDIQAYTGWSIRYAMSDTRLFPFAGSDTGIFYAPADLTGRVVNAEGVPTTFYNVSILGSDGTTYPLGPLPAGVTALRYNINWSTPFYRTMLYRIYIGYNGTEAGQSGGIPGITGAAAGDPLKPGFMLQHFGVEYETAYVCPGVANASGGSACFRATNRPAAVAEAKATNGTSNLSSFRYFNGGESILAYYPGQPLYGRLVLPDGQPVAGARVTIYDGWGIPHMTNLSTANGTFSLVLPPGNDTLNITSGKLVGLNQSGSELLSSVKIPVSPALGFDLHAPPLVQSFTVPNATVSALVYYNVSGNSSFSPKVDPVVSGANVTFTVAPGAVPIVARTDPSGTFVLHDVAPGEYTVTVAVGKATYTIKAQAVKPGKVANLFIPLTPSTVSGSVFSTGTVPVPGATVSLVNASGVLRTTQSGVTGSYRFAGVRPGAYALIAVGSNPTETSGRVGITVTTSPSSVLQNLSVLPRATVLVEVTADGRPLGNATLTATPQVLFSNATLSALQSILVTSTNSSAARTNAQGVATLTLPRGAYSLQALARVNGVIYSGLASINVSTPGSTSALSLTTSPARSVVVRMGTPSSTANKTVVLAFTPAGTEMLTWAAPNGTASVLLPKGQYTLLGLSGVPDHGASSSAGLTSVNVTGSTAVALPLVQSTPVNLKVGTPTGARSFLAAVNATVAISAGSTGPTVLGTTAQNGSVQFYLPSRLPSSAGGYCVSASALGFRSNTTCGLSIAELSNLEVFRLDYVPVAVTLHVAGLPVKTVVSVNITGQSPGASTVQLRGLPTFSLTLPPGTYGVGAYAVIGQGSKVYLPSSVLSTTIAFGATYSNLTLFLQPEINASGTLSLPAGLSAANTTVRLVSPVFHVNVTGTEYTKQFRAAPGNYTATVQGTIGGVPFINVSRLSIAVDGSIRPKLVLSQEGVLVNLTLTKASSAKADLNTTVVFVGPTGLAIPAQASRGVAATELPPGTYRVFANATSTTSGANGTYFTAWTALPGASCGFSVNASHCSVVVQGSALTVQLSGVLVTSGSVSPVPGVVRLVGPYPAKGVTVVAAPNGTFAVALAPGAYTAYATSTGSPVLAGFTPLLALPGVAGPVVLRMDPTLSVTVRPYVGNSSSGSAGLSNVTVRNALGLATAFSGVSLGSTLNIALPAGNYTVTATSPGSRNGVSGIAVASQKINLRSGNLAVNLGLAVPVTPKVGGTLTGPTRAQVAPGNSTTFSFSVRNTGNVPVTIRPVGSPSGWSFNFSFTKLTLAPGASATGQVRVGVPRGTPVAHPAVVISFNLTNGTQAGTISPSPELTVLPTYGVVAGTTAGSPPRIGAETALLPFYLLNSGNTNETVRLSVVDSGRLSAYGWTTSWEQANKTIGSGVVNLTAGENASLSLNLTARSSVAIAPGSATVQATVTNLAPSAISTVVLKVPRAGLRSTPGSLLVTGPSVAGGPSSVPDWLVPLIAFVPTIALIVGIATFRWWRTRRWTRR
jgi:dolichyl-phosphooligosaccharide-protein glycotransferase